jgi:RNA polymerase sigma factor (sigma-70 family)
VIVCEKAVSRMPTDSRRIEDLLREVTPRVLAALIRRYGRFDTCEDAVQEALLAAATQWPDQGVPDNPTAWLVTVATRRLTDQWRGDQARRRREATAAALTPADEFHTPAADSDAPTSDDTLTLLLLCCHPELSPPSQVALTLRAVGGLTTAQIARAFLVPEPTMGQRISRAKQRIRTTGARFEPPPRDQRAERLRVVLHVLYLIFNEGYTATSGPDLGQVALATEAIRLTRQVHGQISAEADMAGEVAGLLALMLLTEARRAARTRQDGSLVPLTEQDRALWRTDFVAEGVQLLTNALARSPIGQYQVQAAIAAIHDEAPTPEDTDWAEISALYRLLATLAPGPMVTLNQAVAVAMVEGPHKGLEVLATLDEDQRMTASHRLDAVRAHLLEMAGDRATARIHYRQAARRTTSIPERRYLEHQADRLT